MNANLHKSRRSRPARTAVIAGLSVVAMTAALAGSPAPPAAAAQPESVANWIDDRAVPIRDLDRPGADLMVLRRATRNAEIVGLGEAAHALAEVTALKRRAVEFLVEKRGYRSLAWEDDWTLGVKINDYIHGRRDDRDALVGEMSVAHRTREVADLLTWLRDYNRTHRDDVRFTGVEYFATAHLAYDAVHAYVAEHAPHLVDELSPHLEKTRPNFDGENIKDMQDYIEWYMSDEVDQEPFLRSAREVYRIVASAPHRPGDRDHALALHHARQIRSWYTAYSLPQDEIFAYRDARAAENLRWWQDYTDDKVIYWAAAAHTADVPDLVVGFPGGGAMRLASVGSFLDEWYGDRYVRVGYTFDHGTIRSEDGALVRMPPAPPEWFEAPLGDVPRQRYVVDLGRHATPQVREWLEAPMVTRGVPAAGPASTMTGSTPDDWYDVIVHSQRVSPATPLR